MKMIFFLCMLMCCLILMMIDDGDTRKKNGSIDELNQEYEYRFYVAVTSISPKSYNFIQEAFNRYRPESNDKSYFDNLDAIALLELVEEEARERGTHNHIATFIRQCPVCN